MPFEERGATAERVAVIGGGVSGMGAAHNLSGTHNVTIFEADAKLGGHARTIIAGRNGDQPVDTGFIVFNYENYPHLSALFNELGVPVIKSNMSFGVSSHGVDYALNSIDSVFAQRRNLVRPSFVRMIRDILKFNKHAEAAVRPGITMGDLIDNMSLGAWFREYYLTPFSGAIWSTPKNKILDFPADAMIRFFKNHGILGWEKNHQWYTVDGGSRTYVDLLERKMTTQGVDIRTSTAIDAVRRVPGGVEIKANGCEWELFDDVVFATHADISLSLLADASGVERTALGAFQYQPNEAILHSDTDAMPKRRKVWSSWTYVDTGKAEDAPIDLTYWMNSLQCIPNDDPLFVTLNRDAPLRDDLVHDVHTFRHPLFDSAAIAAQDTVRAINGQNRTWFCGAWMANGFHEDGLASGVEVAQSIATAPAMALAAE